MAIANYSTTVAVHRSVNEIQQLLAANGAVSVMTDYRDGAPANISFVMLIANQPVSFRLTANEAGVLRAMQADPKVPKSYRTEVQALKVAWRILRDWVRAQLAIIEAGIVTLPQVMLPYAVTGTGQTVFERLEEAGPALLQLESGGTP